jgi:hypothetical protein
MNNYLTPAALVLLVKAEAHATVVGHLLAAVDQHVNVVRVVQWLRLAPDHCTIHRNRVRFLFLSSDKKVLITCSTANPLNFGTDPDPRIHTSD